MASPKSTHILCTGGLGYIGSHTVVQLLDLGYRVTILDNLCNASHLVLSRIKALVPSEAQLGFVDADLKDIQALKQLFSQETFDAVIHYAGLKAVGESVNSPLKYYQNNVSGTLNLLQVMDEANCHCIVFSSSATVYKAKSTAVNEDDPLGGSNPYGQTKLMVEQILQDLYNADKKWNISILRYFNPVGAHPSAMIGESPREPTNLLPVIQHVSIGKRKQLDVFGNDWDTPDGTGVRDYIHVDDLAAGHLAALKKLLSQKQYSGQLLIHNLGRGSGLSVMELKSTYEKVSGSTIPYEMAPRRPGDLAYVVADVTKAEKELGWTAKKTIEEACESAWKWQIKNPNGYE